MAPPPVAILEGLFGLLDHRVLVALCDADVPDLLAGPMHLDDLARQAGADRERLERLLRAAAVNGWVRFDRRGRVRPTPFTRFLRRDHPGGWRAWVDFAGGPEITSAVARVSVAPGTDPFLAANGAPFFDWMSEHPDRWRTFDEAMSAGARMHALALLAALDWPVDSSICDVGGGTGQLLATMLDLLPQATGTVLDLPDVVARATQRERLTAQVGDMFDAVPAGFDTYLLVNVLHDWGDDDVATILSTLAAAAGPARIVVVDADHPKRPRDRIATGADVLMAALTGGGRERDGGALATLAAAAGLRLVDSTRLASGDWAHELRVTAPRAAHP
ncbi:MAG: methyltransferase [Acidimicrobiia bacterium]|nr:methyltransferase [Acidimicrobiia bacterium]